MKIATPVTAWPAPLEALLMFAAVMASVLVAYLPMRRAGFIWDDDRHVTDNPVLTHPGGLIHAWIPSFQISQNIPLTQTPLWTPQYYPLTHTSFWIESRLWGLQPFGYHLDNVLMHGLSAMLLWLVLCRMGIPGAPIAAMLFALHPLQVESVAWITERKNVLSLLLELAAILTYLAFDPALTTPTPTGRPRRWDVYAAAFVLFIAAMLAKTVACTMPVILAILIWRQRGTLRRRQIMPLLPMLVVGAAMGMLTGFIERHRVGAFGPDWQSITLTDRVLIAGRAIWFYLGKLAWPTDLAFGYPKWSINPAIAWQWLFPVLAAIVLAALWLVRQKTGRGPLAAAMIFVVVLAPALGLINVYPMRYVFVADHYAYAAGIAIFASAGVIVRAVARRRAEVNVLSVAALAVLGWLTFYQCHAYRNPEALWRDTIEKNPSSWLARENLAVVLMYEPTEPDIGRAQPGNDAATRRRGRLLYATALFREVARLRPNHDKVYLNWARASEALGRDADALDELHKAAAITPRNVEVWVELGQVCRRLQKHDEARTAFETALSIDKDSAEARTGLAEIAKTAQSAGPK